MASENQKAAARQLIAETRYEYEDASNAGLTHSHDGEAISGWLNGKVILKEGQSFDAGGGWVDLVGLVESYNYRDAGQVEELAEALGLDIEDTLQLLHDDCPTAWNNI